MAPRKASKIIFLFFVTLISNAQIELNNANLDYVMMGQGAGRVFRNGKGNASKIEGSPYLQFMYNQAQVNDIKQRYYMRYNVFADEFEFISQKNDTLILDKIQDFNKITFVGINKKYELVDYTNSAGKNVKGYLIAKHNRGDFTLYVKENISFYDGKIAKTSLEKDMPARYVKEDNSYYFKNKDRGTVEFPSNKKQLIKLFPEKKNEIETFLKANKVGFDEDYDRIKIIDFLATL